MLKILPSTVVLMLATWALSGPGSACAAEQSPSVEQDGQAERFQWFQQTFSSRVLIDGGKYAGTWSHDDVKGHLFGTIQPRVEP